MLTKEQALEHQQLVAEERWIDVRVLLESLHERIADIHVAARVFLENDLAWAKLMTGDVKGGLALATTVCESAPPGIGADWFLFTRAVGILLDGRAEEALPLLERAAAVPTDPRRHACRYFYLGEALLALGRTEAFAAYRKAREAEPSGPYAERADARRAAAGYL
jgi:hypothetical protein